MSHEQLRVGGIPLAERQLRMLDDARELPIRGDQRPLYARVSVRAGVDESRLLRLASEALPARHESLRSRFCRENGQWQVGIETEAGASLESVEIGGQEGPQYAAEMSDHVLLLRMTHYVSDAVTVGVLLRDLERLYKREISPLPPSYYDMTARWWRRFRSGEFDMLRARHRRQTDRYGLWPTIDIPGAHGHADYEPCVAVGCRVPAQTPDGASVSLVALHSLRAALFQMGARRPLTIQIEVAGRHSPSDWACAGLFTDYARVIDDEEGDGRIGADLATSARQLATAVRDSAFPFLFDAVGVRQHFPDAFSVLLRQLRPIPPISAESRVFVPDESESRLPESYGVRFLNGLVCAIRPGKQGYVEVVAREKDCEEGFVGKLCSTWAAEVGRCVRNA